MPDNQCFHFCESCRRDWWHPITSNSITLDRWRETCPACVASGKTEKQIKARVTSNALDEGRIEEGRTQSPEECSTPGSTHESPGATEDYEGIWDTPLDGQGIPRQVARAARDFQSEL